MEKNIPEVLQVELKKSRWELIGDIFRNIIRGAFIILLFFILIGLFSSEEFLQEKFATESIDWYENTVTQKLPLEKDTIAFIPINGVILNEEALAFEEGTASEDILRMLDNAQNNEWIKAIILQIDSPGGTVLDSEKIAQKVIEVKKYKKVYALLESMAASGGYYIASQANKIFAYSETLTGSIGVIMQFPNAKKLMEKVGVDMVTLTSGNMKAGGSPFTEFNTESQKVFQTLVDESFETFLDRVATGRNIDKDELRSFADGRIYSGSQALQLGLIDAVGGIESLKQELGQEGFVNVNLLRYFVPLSPFEEVFGPVRTTIKSWIVKPEQKMMLYYR